MAKAAPKPEPVTADAAPAATAATALDPSTSVAMPVPPMPRMGDTVMVLIKPGALLRNNETGGYFAEGAETPQTVTVTLLRRLADGDLVLVP